MSKTEQLEARISELEKLVRDLQARPVFVPYVQTVPTHPVVPYAPPTWAPTNWPWIGPMPVTCGDSVTAASITVS